MGFLWSLAVKWGRILIVVSFSTGMMQGCGMLTPPPVEEQPYDADMAVFSRGLAAYERGNIDSARIDFYALAEAGGQHSLFRDARLGMLCCDLLLADTPDAYDRAITKWRRFMRGIQKRGEPLNPRLMVPLVVRMVPIGLLPSDGISFSVEKKDMVRNLSAEVKDLKKKAGEVEPLQRQLREIRFENQNLKEKIKALEDIDQDIQKKKMVHPAEEYF